MDRSPAHGSKWQFPTVGCSDHWLIVASLIGGQDTDVVEASAQCQCSNFIQNNGSVVSNKMTGVPAVDLLDSYEEVHDIAVAIGVGLLWAS